MFLSRLIITEIPLCERLSHRRVPQSDSVPPVVVALSTVLVAAVHKRAIAVLLDPRVSRDDVPELVAPELVVLVDLLVCAGARPNAVVPAGCRRAVAVAGARGVDVLGGEDAEGAPRVVRRVHDHERGLDVLDDLLGEHALPLVAGELRAEAALLGAGGGVHHVEDVLHLVRIDVLPLDVGGVEENPAEGSDFETSHAVGKHRLDLVGVLITRKSYKNI